MRLGVKDVAVKLGVTEKTVLRWVEQDGLPASEVDGQYRFNPAAVLEWATARGVKLPSALVHDTVVGVPRALPRITDALKEGGIHTGIRVADRRSALAALVSRITLPRGVEAKDLLDVLLAREMLGSTGVGDGIAIPHVRNPIVLRVAKPIVVLGLLEPPVDFAAIDGKPVHTLFLVVSPTTRAHLHLLSRLGFLLQDAAVRDALTKRRPAAEILASIERAEANIPPAPGG